MNDYKPPFHITDKMTALIAEISEQVGRDYHFAGKNHQPTPAT